MLRCFLTEDLSAMRLFLVAPFLALVSGAVLLGTGCAKQTSSNPSDPGTNPTPGVVDDAAGFYVRYVTNTKYFYDLHKDNAGFGTACTAQANESVQCYLEAPELDLYFNGVTLQYNVPSDMCTYLRFRSYDFIRYPVAVSPSFINVDTDKNGQICHDANSNGVCDVGEVDERCAYDYSGDGGPNCCEGRYTKVSRMWDSTQSAYATPSTTIEDWGGHYGDCLSGPATKSHPKDKSNVPIAILSQVDGTGLNETYPIDAPIKLGLKSNTYLANFFDPADHLSGLPAGLTPTSAVSPSAIYFWQCLDNADDVIAEITLNVREWNTKAAFDARASNPTGYDITGPEPSPFGPGNIENDRPDWKDFDTSVPGDSL